MTAASLLQTVDVRCDASVRHPDLFFGSNVDAVTSACLAMARRFQRGGRLLAYGEGAQASDAEHVAVEFVHPVVVGKRALPALALELPRGRSGDRDDGVAATLAALASPDDILMAITADGGSRTVRTLLHEARSLGLLTVHLAGGVRTPAPDAGILLHVASDDALVVQEVHETLYHVLWESVHVFFEHGVQ